MSDFSFRVYIDESGDEGFRFHSDGTGSRRWLVLSAVVVRKKNDLLLVDTMKKVRTTLGRPEKQQLHFSELKHEQRVPYVRLLADAPIRLATVLIHKPSIQEPEKFHSEKFRLYRYAVRYLLERVSWLCRDTRIPGEGDGLADVIFSNRSIMSYEDLRMYLRNLRDQSEAREIRIAWGSVSPDHVRAVNHDQLAGLQAADAVASSFYYAVQANRYGEVEDKYARVLLPRSYRHKGSVRGFGVKFWPPEGFDEWASAHPQAGELATELRK